MRIFLSRTLILFYLASSGVNTSLYLLLTAVPVYAMRTGGQVGAGLATGALMLSCVAAELAAPALAARFGYPAVFAAGALLLGVPTLALSISDAQAVILIVCALRGLGFGLAVVVGGALVATLLPAQRRGEGLGIYGIVVGIPAVIGLPVGVWLAQAAGYPTVFATATAAALLGLIALRVPRTKTAQRNGSILSGLRNGDLVRPAIVFSTTAMACGIVVTFLPAVSGMVELALLVQSATATAARWWAGRMGDRHGAGRQLVPGVALSAAGMAALILAASPVAVIAAMVLFGTGFGITQNASLALMYSRTDASGYGTVSAIWNFAYDAAIGAGAAGFGVVAVRTGFPAAFGITAVVMLLVTVAALRRRRIGKAELSPPLSPAPQS